MKRSLLTIVVLFLLGIISGYAQQTTSIAGIVVDAQNNDTLPFVQIYFIKPTSEGNVATSIGTTSSMQGRFSLSNDQGYTTVLFQMMGYKTEMVNLRLGQNRRNAVIRLEPDIYNLQDIVVTPKHRKQRYRRKGNPAVELIRNVIAHKDSANVKQAAHYRADTYDRMSFAIDNFYIDFNKPFWKTYSFLQNYIDTTGVTPALTVSVREENISEYYQKKPHKEKKHLTAKRIFGLEDIFSSATLKANINAMFADVDIYKDNMDLMLNRFVSPLSSSLAVSYYQYYIMDTIMVDGYRCIDLAFVPVNSESYSFTGHLYILDDGTYKLKKYAINVPPHINLNFVSDYSIEQSFCLQENGLWAPERINTYAKFYILKNRKQIMAHQTKIYKNFDFVAAIPDTIFSFMQGDVVEDPKASRLPTLAWDTIRPEPLTFYETSVYDMVQDFLATPKFNSLVQFVDAMTTGYVCTTDARHWRKSKWDFGPIWNTVSWNMLEGVRLRVGGTTTTNLHPHLFLNGYVAYGFQDNRPKYSVNLVYAFNQKKYHPYEPLRHNLTIGACYDVEEPGQSFEALDRDQFLMSIPTSTPRLKNMQYVFHARANYVKEWPNHFSIRAGFDFQHNVAAGAMHYYKIMDTRTVSNMILNGFNSTVLSGLNQPVSIHGTSTNLALQVPFYYDYNLSLELRYSPGEVVSVNKMGKESPFNMEKDAPVIRITHQIGLLDDRIGKPFFYNRTEISAEKRFWLSSFGHIDARLQTGIIWNKVPFTKLYIPPTSTSIFLAMNSFNLMQPMEFLMDQYIALYATYYFKGWILNRIPGINRLKLRGVVSFAGIYGGLTNKNNPYLNTGTGIYEFPNAPVLNANGEYLSGYTSSPIGKLPYMELTAGIENIFKVLRIDYVRRLTYNEYMLPNGTTMRRIPAWGRNGVKLTFRIAL